MKNKKTILSIILLLWMIIIFLFSNQNAITSQSTSDKVTDKVVEIVEELKKSKVNKDKISLVIRKTAHFGCYFILGILVFFTLKQYKLKNILIYSILFCFIFACSDEFHQLFLSGRTARITDILLDSTGSTISSIIMYYVTIKKGWKYGRIQSKGIH